MNKKIKAIRLAFDLTETEIASLLNISNYKYKRIENGSIEIKFNLLILISIMYNIPIDMLVFDKFGLEEVLSSKSISNIKNMQKDKILSVLLNNLCRFNGMNCYAINYRVTKNILKKCLDTFSNNLYNLRIKFSFEIFELAKEISVNVENYLNIERGICWPSINEVIHLSRIFSISINELLFVIIK